jgi:hypothetical protein
MTAMPAMGSRTIYTAAGVLGLAVALLDTVAPFGDDSSKLTLLLLILVSGVLGLVHPKKFWLTGILVGIWLPLVPLIGRLCNLPTHIHPNTYAAILLLLPVSLVVCLFAAFCGTIARRTFFS